MASPLFVITVDFERVTSECMGTVNPESPSADRPQNGLIFSSVRIVRHSTFGPRLGRRSSWHGANEIRSGSDVDESETLAHVKVYSASRHLEDVRTAPSSVSIITAEDIRHNGWRTLGDALNSLRGFYISNDRQ